MQGFMRALEATGSGVFQGRGTYHFLTKRNYCRDHSDFAVEANL